MSRKTARTNGPCRVNRDMAEFGGQSVKPLDESVVADHSTADAGADGEEKHVAVSAACAVFPLTQTGQVRVVIYMHGHTELPGEFFTERKILPFGDIRRGQDHAVMWIQRSRRGHTDR